MVSHKISETRTDSCMKQLEMIRRSKVSQQEIKHLWPLHMLLVISFCFQYCHFEWNSCIVLKEKKNAPFPLSGKNYSLNPDRLYIKKCVPLVLGGTKWLSQQNSSLLLEKITQHACSARGESVASYSYTDSTFFFLGITLSILGQSTWQ